MVRQGARHGTPKPSGLADVYLSSDDGLYLAIPNINRAILYRFSLEARRQLEALQHISSQHSAATTHPPSPYTTDSPSPSTTGPPSPSPTDPPSPSLIDHPSPSPTDPPFPSTIPSYPPSPSTTTAFSPPAKLVTIAGRTKEIITLTAPAHTLPPLASFPIIESFIRRSNTHSRRRRRRRRTRSPVLVPRADSALSIEEQISVLAAAEILDLHPPPLELRRIVLLHLTAHVPSAEIIELVWCKLGPYERCESLLIALAHKYFSAVEEGKVALEHAVRVCGVLGRYEGLYDLFWAASWKYR